MRVLLVGTGEAADRLADALAGVDVAVERTLEPAPVQAGAEEVALIANSLLELEDRLGEDAPDAVLLASASGTALAALLVATKLGIPTAAVGVSTDARADVNARLIGQLADTTLAPDAAATLAWVRDAYTSAP